MSQSVQKQEEQRVDKKQNSLGKEIIKLREELSVARSQRLQSLEKQEHALWQQRERQRILKQKYKSFSSSAEPYRKILQQRQEKDETEEILELKITLCHEIHRMEIEGELLDLLKTQCTRLIESVHEEIELQAQRSEEMEERLEGEIDRLESEIHSLRERRLQLMRLHLLSLQKMKKKVQPHFLDSLMPNAIIPPSLASSISLDSVAASALSYFQASPAAQSKSTVQHDSFASRTSLSNSFSSFFSRRESESNVPMSLME